MKLKLYHALLLICFLVASCKSWDFERKTFLRCTTPSAQIEASPNQLTVAFALNQVSGDISNITWNFGTGTPVSGTEQTRSVTYPQPGTYTVTAELTNLCGQRTTATTTVTVTNVTPPAVITLDPTGVTSSSAMLGCTVTSNGNSVVSQFGVCYSSTVQQPAVDNSTVLSLKSGLVINNPNSFQAVQLAQNTTYYVRAFAINGTGTPVYGEVKTFKTPFAPVTTGLIAYYPMDGNGNDLSGNNLHGVLHNEVSVSEGHKGGANTALFFDGDNDFMDVQDTPLLRFTSAMSISLWIKSSSPTNGTMQVLAKSDYFNQHEQYSINIRPLSSTDYIFNFDVKQNSNCVSGGGWQNTGFQNSQWIGTWHHLVYIYEGRTTKLYLDGVLKASKDNLPGTTIDSCPGGELRFGFLSKDYPFQFRGSLDEVRFYNRSLNETEVQALYNQ